MSDAGVAATDGGAGETAPAAPAAPTVDLSPIQDTLGEITGRLDRFEGLMPQPAQEQAADPWDFTDLFGAEQEAAAEPEAPAQPDMQQLITRLSTAMQSSSEEQIKQAVGPLLETVSNMQADNDAAYLTENYPEFANDEFAQQMIAFADQRAAAAGLSPETARTASYLEDIYKAYKFDQMARGEVPAADLTHDDLEGGSGAVPGGRGEVDIAQQIKAAGSGNSFWT